MKAAAQESNLPVQVISNRTRAAANGTVTLLSWGEKERTMRAMKVFAACWGLALITVIIPLAHFVLVPGFFLAGPIAAWILHGQKSAVAGGEGVCPDCRSPLKIERARDHWPLDDVCIRCHTALSINRA